MNNKAVLERLCTEPKGTPEEALQLAVASEEGLKRQASYRDCELEIKSEPICVCAETKLEKCVLDAEPYLHTTAYRPIKGSKKIMLKMRKYGTFSPMLYFCVETCKECTGAGKNFKRFISQDQKSKLPAAVNIMDEISIDFAGPFIKKCGCKNFS